MVAPNMMMNESKVIDFFLITFHQEWDSEEQSQKHCNSTSYIAVKNLKQKEEHTFQELVVLGYLACLGKGQEWRKLEQYITQERLGIDPQ
jgi:hypothetical protein